MRPKKTSKSETIAKRLASKKKDLVQLLDKKFLRKDDPIKIQASKPSIARFDVK